MSTHSFSSGSVNTGSVIPTATAPAPVWIPMYPIPPTVAALPGDDSETVQACPFCGSLGVVRVGNGVRCEVCSRTFQVMIKPDHAFAPQVTPEIGGQDVSLDDSEPTPPPADDPGAVSNALSDAPAFAPPDDEMSSVVSRLGDHSVTGHDLVLHYIAREVRRG